MDSNVITNLIWKISVLRSLGPEQTEGKLLTEAVRITAPGRFVYLSKGLTHYEDLGPRHGPVVVLVHGFSVPYYMWDKTVGPLIEAGFRVIRYDLFGRGFSDRPKVKYQRELFVTQLRELLEALGIHQPLYLVGTSMGGAIAAAYAADYRESIAKVALIDPLWEPLTIGLLHIPFIGELFATSVYLPMLPKLQYQDFHRPDLFPEWESHFRTQMQYKGFRQALVSTARYFLSRNPLKDYQRVASFGKPVLQIWGTEEKTLNKAGATVLQSLFQTEPVWIEQAGHLPHYEQPDPVNSQLIGFLKSDTL